MSRGLGKKEGVVFLRGGWYPDAHYDCLENGNSEPQILADFITVIQILDFKVCVILKRACVVSIYWNYVHKNFTFTFSFIFTFILLYFFQKGIP